ncbi:hypothetical protein EON63_07775 [archaeon]|nr:MAG: hypothetical protein EON63_07775 [archaeon]
MQCHIQRMGGINDFVLSRCEQFIISVGQDRRMCIWSARQGELLTGVNIDGENDEAMAIDM